MSEVATATEAKSSPFYLVWNPRRRSPTVQHRTFEAAKGEARRLASENAGTFYVLAVVASAELTKLETSEFRFDPSSDPPEPACGECGEPMDRCYCIPF